MAIADAFVGLPIETLILDPLLSAAKGQAALAQVTLDFVDALAFEESDGKDNSSKAKLLDIDLDRLLISLMEQWVILFKRCRCLYFP